MNRIILLLLTLLLFNCSSDNNEPTSQDIPEATLIGRWNLVGLEGSILYEFATDKRYTFYSEDGNFTTLEEVQQQGVFNGLDWYYKGNKVTIDLNFGNFSTLTPQFLCDNYVIRWINDDDELHSVNFREGYVIAGCDQVS